MELWILTYINRGFAMEKKSRSMKKWFTVMTLTSSLVAGGWLYADATSSNICTSYASGDSSSGSECCNKSVSSLCQIDADINNGFSQLNDLITTFYQKATNFTSGFIAYLNGQAVTSAAYINNDNLSQTVTQTTTNTIKKLMTADSTQQLAKMKEVTGQMPSISKDYNVNNFSMSVLMNNPGIDPSVQNQVQQMILNLANVGNPVKNIDANIANQMNKVAVQEFLASLGSYDTITSNALNSLFSIMQERTVVPGLTLPNSAQAVSPYQLEMSNVNQILSIAKDGSFDNASMLDMAKAAYYAQAMTLYELFKLRQSVQQLNATMAVMQLQLLNSIDKSSLEGLRQKAVNG